LFPGFVYPSLLKAWYSSKSKSRRVHYIDIIAYHRWIDLSGLPLVQCFCLFAPSNVIGFTIYLKLSTYLNNIYKPRYSCKESYFRGVRIFCTAVYCLGRKLKHKRNVKAWHGIHFYKNNLWNILVIGNYYVNFKNCQN